MLTESRQFRKWISRRFVIFHKNDIGCSKSHIIYQQHGYFSQWRRIFILNLLKPSSNFTYHQVQHQIFLHSAHIAFVCFVHISEQTATFAVNISNSFVFVTEIENVYCAVRTVFI
jgi:hypothetical protein